MSFCIRPVEAADLDIARAILASFIAELEEVNEEAAERMRLEAEELCSFPLVRKRYFQQGGAFFVMTDRDRIIGMGGVRRISPKLCQLRQLVLLRSFRGRGLGHEMALSLIEWAKDNGFETMKVEVSYPQVDAQKLFSQLRFAALAPTSDGRNQGAHDVTYELDLRPKRRST